MRTRFMTGIFTWFFLMVLAHAGEDRLVQFVADVHPFGILSNAHGDADLHMDNNAGWLGGFPVVVKKGAFGWIISMDYYDCEIDLEPSLGWTINHGELELSDMMIPLGFKRRF